MEHVYVLEIFQIKKAMTIPQNVQSIVVKSFIESLHNFVIFLVK